MLFTGKLKFLEASLSACEQDAVQLSKISLEMQWGREQKHIKVSPFQNTGRKCFLFPVLKSLYTV